MLQCQTYKRKIRSSRQTDSEIKKSCFKTPRRQNRGETGEELFSTLLTLDKSSEEEIHGRKEENLEGKMNTLLKLVREKKRQQEKQFQTVNAKWDALHERSKKMENTLEGVRKR